MSNVVNILELLLVLVAVVAIVGGGIFGLGVLLSGGSSKPNAGQQTTNVHVNVQVAAPAPTVMPATDYNALNAQAAQLAALHARAAAAELYGPATPYGQPIGSAAIYGQIPYGHQAPAVDGATLDRAVDAALQRRLERPELER